MRYEFRGVGVAEYAHDGAAIVATEDGATGRAQRLGTSTLINRAGGVALDDRIVSELCFRRHVDPEVREEFARFGAQARAETGVAGTPPVYRMRIVVELEPLSEAEAEAWWTAQEVRD